MTTRLQDEEDLSKLYKISRTKVRDLEDEVDHLNHVVEYWYDRAMHYAEEAAK